MTCHPLLHRLFTLAGNMAGSHDDLGAGENAIYLVRRRWDVLEHTYDGSFCALFQDGAAGEFQNSKRKEFLSELRPQRIGGHDDKQFLAFHGDENRQHRLRFAGAGGHDDGCRRIRNSPVRVCGVYGAYLWPPEANDVSGRIFFDEGERAVP